MAAAAIGIAKFASAAFASATAAVAGGLTAMGMSAATATAVATQVVTTAATIAITTGISYLLRPSTPSSGMTLDFKPDPKAPVTGMMGYAATGGNKVFQSTWGYNNVVLSLGAALSLGPIDAITQFRADDKVVAFTGSQNEAVGFYDDDMWQKTTLGLPTDAALLPPTGLKYGSPGLSGWGANNAAKGVAFSFWTMVLAKKPEDRNIFVNGVPDPRWIGRWMKLYDWRKDSTYPGGSGSHRENDWRTWEFTENPYVHARAWLRGHHKLNDDGTVDFTKRIAGVGVNPAAIDMPAFNEGANVADANNWKISGSWSSSDSKWDVLVSMLKAGSGAPQQNGAMISVLVNTPRVSTETVTRDNIVGDIQINPLTRRRERKNTIVPRYRSEAHSWEYVPAGAVTSSVYRAEDRNELRSLEIQYTYVRDAKQAAQLAAYDLANLRESIKVNATLKVDALSIRAGDCITFNVPEVGLENQKCIVIRKTTDYQTAMVTVECRSETDGKHAWALGQAANPPPTPSLTGNDPLYMPPPLAVDWTVTPQPPSGGTSQPGIDVTGPIDRGDIASVIVEYGLAAAGPWTSAGPADPATGKYHIAGLRPLQQYWISIRYVANNGTISERYVTGPHTAPDLIAGDLSPTSPTLTVLENQIDDLFDTTTIIEGDLAAAETLIDSVNAEVVAARQGQPNLGARVTQLNTAIQTESVTRASEITRVEAVADLAYIDVAPARFQNLSAWTSAHGGPDIDAADLTGVTFVNDPDLGSCIEGNFNGNTVYLKKNLLTSGRKYRISGKLKVVTAGSRPDMILRDSRLDVNSAPLTRGGINTANTIVGQVFSFDQLFDMGAREGLTPGTAQVRFGIELYGTVRLAEFRVQDATESEALYAGITEERQARIDADTGIATALSATQLEVSNARQGQPNLGARITQVNQARIDGDAANSSAISATQLEVTNARQGEPTLSARITQVNQARIDGDSANSSAIAATQLEVTNARQGEPTLSANITNVKTAITNESTTRATEINRVEAVADLAYIDVAPARFQNLSAWTGTFAGPEIDAADLTGVTFVNDPDMGQSIEGSFTGQTVHMKKNLPTTGRKYRVTISLKVLTAGTQLNMGLRDNRLSVDSTYLTRGNINMPNAVVGQVLTWTTVVNIGARAANTPGTTQVRFGVTLYGTVRLAEFRIQDVTDTENLSASVQTNTIAIVDLETQKALASYEVVAAASGGKPARLKLVSSSLGSAIALDAPWIFFGDNTVFDDATDTMQTTVGSNIRVIANGAAFGASGNLLEWWGPSSVPIGSMTTANGYNGRMTIAPYVFNNAVPDSNITVVSTTGLGSSNGATNAIMVSQSASVKLSPRIKISSNITYDGGSQMTGGVFGDFIVEVYEQNSGGVTVLQSTTMRVDGIIGGAVTSLTGGAINTFPAGQVGSKSGAVTYGIRVRRTGGSGNFINLRASLYMEII